MPRLQKERETLKIISLIFELAYKRRNLNLSEIFEY